VGAAFRTALQAYMDVADTSKGTLLNSETDLSNIDKMKGRNANLDKLPIVPDVTIQYRCGDNIGFGRTHYGLMPFKAFVDRINLHLTATGKVAATASFSIYVIADSPMRASTHPYASRCGIILNSLYSHLQTHFPQAVVIIKRGGDVFLDVVRLTFAKVVICSASTFCLWPAISNLNTAYFPLTPLAAGTVP
jgi:hypothetical protein